MRFFDIVEPTIDGIGRLVAAIGRARMRVGVNKTANRHNWAHYVLRSWCHQRENIFNGGMRIRPGRVAKHQLLLDNQPSDLGFHAWKDPKKAAGLVLETCLAWGYHDGGFCRADLPPMNRGDAAAATWIFRGDGSRRRRGRRGYSADTSRGDAAAKRTVGRDLRARLRYLGD